MRIAELLYLLSSLVSLSFAFCGSVNSSFWQCGPDDAWYYDESSCIFIHYNSPEALVTLNGSNLTQEQIQYSPFQPYWHFPFWANDAQKCWYWSECVYSRAQQVRIQQFGATSLVMGLVPLTLKDIAWPGRRIVYLTQRLHPVSEILVRALGLDPKILEEGLEQGLGHVADCRDVVLAWYESVIIFKWIKSYPRLMATMHIVGLFLTFSAIAITELYSKRSALGCTYPVFVLSWYLIGLLPAMIHVLCSKYLEKWKTSGSTEARKASSSALGNTDSEVSSSVSAIQGHDEWWIVQLSWAIYYIAGTLVYTSIMAVTVTELVVWVVVSIALTATCKLMAFLICASSVLRRIRVGDPSEDCRYERENPSIGQKQAIARVHGNGKYSPLIQTK